MKKLVASLALGTTILLLSACSSNDKVVTQREAATTQFQPPSSADTFPNEDIPSTTAPEVIHSSVGDTVTLSEVESGLDVSKVAITKVSFTKGSEYDTPEHGWYMGAYVKVRALANGQSSLWGDFYATVNGHHYDGDACCPDQFKPTLDYVDLNEGETSEGWLVFDVPAKHGQIVLVDSSGLDNNKIGTWAF